MDPTEPPAKPPPASRIVAAFAVHVFPACGAACALLALMAAVRAEWARMFLWLGLALVIDGVDGTLARRLRVAELLPRWSGELLDFVVDFPTYVFVPAYAIAAGGLLPPAAALPLGLIVTVTGALYFADRRMKSTRPVKAPGYSVLDSGWWIVRLRSFSGVFCRRQFQGRSSSMRLAG